MKKGFYIDVGANDPVIDSVTKVFYDRGWRGINVEPLKSHYQDLLEARPKDINLLCAAGSKRGQIDIWECKVRGWATASSDVIQKHEQEGYTGVLHKVPLFPLEDICEQYVQGDIHFLKIDVEGFEKDVLQGINFKKFRPWIVVVEATKPNSTEEIYENYEALIVSNNYTFAYADGLNRFYISKEQAPYLLDRFRYPPNVFDGYIRVQQYDSEIKAEQAQQQTVEAKAKAEQAQAALDAHVAQLHAVYNSSSWRITAPLRWPMHQLHLLRTHGFKQRAKAALKKVLPSNEHSAVQRQLFLDISELVHHDAATGIQRVVKNYLINLLNNPPKGFRVLPVYATTSDCYRYADAYIEKKFGIDSTVLVDSPITWQRGDIFFGLDLQHQVQLSQAITYERMRNDGVIVQFLIYDLLPIQLKELFADENLYHLHEKLMQLIGQQHQAICISKTTADAYKHWLQEKNIAHNPMLVIDWVHMGADLEVYSSRGLPENSSITLKALKTRPTFLSVCTLEPRKGHTQILDAVEILWANHQDINLVFVGHQGWKVEKLVERIFNHPENGKRLFWLKGISDEYLELVYQASTCLIAASYGEGFGLPLIEAAKHKLPIICRDMPIFREVAGQHAFYFDASDAIGLSASIKQWLLLYEKTAHPTSDRIPWKTWSESAENLKHLLIGSTLDKKERS